MASIATEPNGFKRIIFKGLDGKRRPIRLGKCSEKFAIAVADHVEEIINQALMPSRPLPRATAEWLADMSPKMEAKLVAVGLIHPRESTKSITLGEFLDAYLVRRSDVKDGTRVFYGHTRRNLLDVFGADRPLASITAGDADDFRRHLQRYSEPQENHPDADPRKKKPLAAATVARRCSLARTFFRDAVRRKLIDANPFEDIGGGNKANPERAYFNRQRDHHQSDRRLPECRVAVVGRLVAVRWRQSPIRSSDAALARYRLVCRPDVDSLAKDRTSRGEGHAGCPALCGVASVLGRRVRSSSGRFRFCSAESAT